MWQDFVDTSGHGKLLVDQSIYPLAYATNVNEQVLEVRLPRLVSKAMIGGVGSAVMTNAPDLAALGASHTTSCAVGKAPASAHGVHHCGTFIGFVSVPEAPVSARYMHT